MENKDEIIEKDKVNPLTEIKNEYKDEYIIEDDFIDIDDKDVVINNEREFEEVDGGVYLEGNGFYITPNGSFWDPDGVYFNRDGFDKHEGYFDENENYVPGRGWIPHLLCYEDELKENKKDKKHLEFDDINDDDDVLDYENLDDLHENIDYLKKMDKDKKDECVITKQVLNFKGDNHPSKRKNSETTETKVDVDEFFDEKLA